VSLSDTGAGLALVSQQCLGTDHAQCAEARALADVHRALFGADGDIRETKAPALCISGTGTVALGSQALGAADLAARIAWLRTLS